jgi:hypothetical protein
MKGSEGGRGGALLGGVLRSQVKRMIKGLWLKHCRLEDMQAAHGVLMLFVQTPAVL